MRFELEFLESYDDEALLAELRRVAALIHTPNVSIGQFTALAKVHASTLQKRFGGWKEALDAAGLGHRFDNSSSKKEREAILEAIKATANKLETTVLTRQQFQEHSKLSDSSVRRIFGSWKNALKAADLAQAASGKRYTNAFVQRVNSEPSESLQTAHYQSERPEEIFSESKRGPRDLPLALRYNVLKRDHFRCVTCGASPAIQAGIVLHVDHIHPWALGGLLLRTTSGHFVGNVIWVRVYLLLNDANSAIFVCGFD